MRSRFLLLFLLLLALSARASSWEEQRSDLELLRDRHLPASLAYSVADRAQARAFIDDTIRGGQPLSDAAFLLALLRVAAFAHNAHDAVHLMGWLPATRLPMRMLWFPDAMVVARASPGHADLLGARVERIEDLTPAQLQARLRPFFGGTDDYLRWNSLWAIELGGMLHAMGIARSSDRLRLRVRLRDANVVDREIAFVPRAQAPAGAMAPRYWSAPAYASEVEHGWKSARDGAAEPLYLREPDAPFRIVEMAAAQALYVQFRANSTADAGGQPIEPFVERVGDELRRARPRNLVLDLRFDVGGDIDKTRELAREIASAVPGRIFVLVGPYTFSAGIVFAAAVKHDAGARVTFVGEEPGDRPRFWSEGRNTCLPSSRYCLHASDGLWDLLHGCAGEPACYGDRLDARVDSLSPDLRAPLDAAAWLGGRDPALEAVEQALRR